MTHQVVFLGRLWFLFVIFIQFSKLKEKWDCKTLVGHRRPRCSVCWPFPGRQKGKWGNVVFVQIPTAEVYFPTQRYISRPQRWIFKLRPLGISHTTDQPGAKNLYSLLASKAGKWSRKIIERSGHWYPLQRFLQWMSTNKHSTKKETRSMDKLDCLNETMSHHQIGLDLLLRRQCCLSSWQWKEQIFTFDLPATRCVLDTKYSWRALRKENCPNIWYYIGVH